MKGLIAFSVLIVTLLLMVWGARTILLGLVVQSAERGTVIPLSLTLSRVPIPAGDTFCLSLPARRGAGWWPGSVLVLTSRRVRLVRRGKVEVDLPLAQVAHLTVQGLMLRIEQRGSPDPLVVRVAQPAVIARYIRHLAMRATGRTA